MAVTTFAGGINRGTAVCPLSDGTVVVASNQGQLTRFDNGGTEIESTTLGATALALAAHPAGTVCWRRSAATGSMTCVSARPCPSPRWLGWPASGV